MVPRFKGQCNTPAFAITEIWIVRKQANVRAYRLRSNKYAKSPGYWGSDSVGYGPGLPAPQDDRGFAPCHQRSPQRDLPNPTDLRKITFVHVRHHRRSFPFLTRNFADLPPVFSMFNPTGKAARSQFAGLLRNVPDISSAYRSNRRKDRCGATFYRKISQRFIVAQRESTSATRTTPPGCISDPANARRVLDKKFHSCL